LEYRAGSEIWEEAVREGKIKPEEHVVPSDSARGLALFTNEEIAQACQKAHKKFYFRPLYIIHMLSEAFRTKDFSFIKVGLRVFRDNVSKFLK
jgi:hypothetical protein